MFRAAAEDPFDESVVPRKALLKRLELYLKQPFPGIEDVLATMADQCEASAARARQRLLEIFAERDAGQARIAAIAPGALRAASTIEPIWDDVATAWQELARS